MLTDGHGLVENMRVARDGLHELLEQAVVGVNKVRDVATTRLRHDIKVGMEELGKLADLRAGQLVDGAGLEPLQLLEEGLALSQQLGKLLSCVFDTGGKLGE